MMAGKNNFDKRGGELLPRELMERAADPALVSGDWRTLEERIKDWNKTHPDLPIDSVAAIAILPVSARWNSHFRTGTS